MTTLYLLEPESPGAEWAPFAGVRPLAELRAGIWRVRERWEAAVGNDATALLGSHAAGFSEGDEPAFRPVSPIDGPALVGAAWFAPTGAPLRARGIDEWHFENGLVKKYQTYFDSYSVARMIGAAPAVGSRVERVGALLQRAVTRLRR